LKRKEILLPPGIEVTSFRARCKAGNFLASWATIVFSRGTLLHGVSVCGVVSYFRLGITSLLPNPWISMDKHYSQFEKKFGVGWAIINSVSTTCAWLRGRRLPACLPFACRLPGSHLGSAAQCENRSKGKGKVVTVPEHHAMKTYWRSGGIAPPILDLGTGWPVFIKLCFGTQGLGCVFI